MCSLSFKPATKCIYNLWKPKTLENLCLKHCKDIVLGKIALTSQWYGAKGLGGH